MSQYLKNWYLFLRGFAWLWDANLTGLADPEIGCVLVDNKLHAGLLNGREDISIKYKPGWSPLKFCLLVYWWDYGLGTLCGYGVVSLSRAWWERSQVRAVTAVPVRAGRILIGPYRYPFARLMTRLLNRVLNPEHSALTGPRLWSSKSIRD
jgi:hypothetical protein